MGRVFTHMTMSLDGYIAGPDDNPGELFDWYEAGEVSVARANEDIAFEVDEASAEALRGLSRESGALVAGRRLFDYAGGWNDTHPSGAAVVVVAPRPPAGTRRAVGRGRPSSTESSRRSARRGRSPAKRTSRSRAPTSRRRRSTSAWSTGTRQPRTGAVRRGHPLLLQAGPRTPALRGPGRRPGTTCPPPQVPGPSLTAG